MILHYIDSMVDRSGACELGRIRSLSYTDFQYSLSRVGFEFEVGIHPGLLGVSVVLHPFEIIDGLLVAIACAARPISPLDPSVVPC